MLATPPAPPASSALAQSTGYTGHAAAIAAASTAATVLQVNGSFKPCRSANRPAGSDRKICVPANKATSRPIEALL